MDLTPSRRVSTLHTKFTGEIQLNLLYKTQQGILYSRKQSFDGPFHLAEAGHRWLDACSRTRSTPATCPLAPPRTLQNQPTVRGAAVCPRFGQRCPLRLAGFAPFLLEKNCVLAVTLPNTIMTGRTSEY